MRNHYSIHIIVALIIYSSVLFLPIPQEILLATRYNTLPIIILIACVGYFSYYFHSESISYTILGVTMLLFALPLAALWHSGMTEIMVIGGLLPWNDSHGYYREALRLVEGSTFTPWLTRPLGVSLLATILGVTQQNLQLSIAIFMFIIAVASFLLIYEIQRSHGMWAGLVVLTILFLFYREWSGTTMTENTGLILGSTALALLWRGSGQKSNFLLLLGMMLLTLALQARTGAFFILPVLVVWGARLVRQTSTYLSFKFLWQGIAVILVGFLLNFIVLKVVGHPDGTNPNFYYILYGLASGGKNWTQVYHDYPETKGEVVTYDNVKRIRELAIEKAIKNPLDLLYGLSKSTAHFLDPRRSVLNFVGGPTLAGANTANIKIFSILANILAILGFLHCFWQRHEPYSGLVFAATIGIILSAPFLPLYDGGPRVFAATIPFTAVLVMFGVLQVTTFIINKLKWQVPMQPVVNTNHSHTLVHFSSVLVAVVCIGPIVTYKLGAAPQLPETPCPTGLHSIYVRNGATLHLVADTAVTHVPFVRFSDFMPHWQDLQNNLVEIVPDVDFFKVGTVLMSTLDLKNGQMVWLVAESLPPSSNTIKVCGQLATKESLKKYGFFHVHSMQELNK